MSALLHVWIGAALAIAGWAIPRLTAGMRRLSVAALLDAAPLGFVFSVLFVASGRPIFAGAVAFALGAGFGFADWTMRTVLREPVVFTALSELPQVFTHPHLYLPFAGTETVVGGLAMAVLAGLALLVAEPAVTPPHPTGAAVLTGLVGALLWRLGREPWLGVAARALRRLAPSGEPFADAARLGPVAMLIVHGVIARAERAARRARLAAPAILGERAPACPIVLVQCESFFDARRAFPRLSPDILAGYDAACAGGSHGRLTVSAWGANTTRAEFAALTGADDAALGYDRFNPYHALARGRIGSQVWRLRTAGYRTICLHPFDRRFFRRDLAMPALGFETFLGRETLGGGRTPPYMSDPELARHILRSLDQAGPRAFIFAITMGNHGPWLKDFSSPPADLIRGPTNSGKLFIDGRVKSGQGEAELHRYLEGLRQSDEMIQILIDGLARRGDGGLLGFYGDHLPSLPHVFDRIGFDDWRSDYAIWSADGVSRRRDLHAHELGRVLVDAALAPGNRAVFDAVVAAAPDA
ncbi:MAG TPA: LTA synthase family protein [Stellaceae bacterium]|nr:LTA synthase family protein [Stellaceae bacterium]